MSYYLLDFTKKINFSFDNLIIGKKISLDNDNYKYYIYYQENEIESPKEIYIRLPQLRIIYNLGNYKYNQLSIPIYPSWEGTNNFIEFIENLERDIIECFNQKNIKKEWKSILLKKGNMTFIKANVFDKFKITSNTLSTNITLTDFKINGQIDIVLKISYLWSKGINIGLSSQIYQIKYLAPPCQLDINFIDEEKKIVLPQLIPLAPPLAPQLPILLKQEKTDKIDKVEKVVKVIPSVNDLQKAIKGLKSVNIKD